MVPGDLGGRSVVAKVLSRPDALWRWYFEREALVYARLPAGLGPRLIEAHPQAGVLLLEQLPGRALGRLRRADSELEDRDVGQCVQLLERIEQWESPCVLAEPPPGRVVREIRERLLEDPTEPEWITSGIARCAKLSIVSVDDAQRMTRALRDYDELGTCHGDFLPRNLIAAGTSVAAIDWECAGRYPRDWDRALLWVALPAEHRSLVSPRDPSKARLRAFTALCAFAGAREVKFATRTGAENRAQRQRDLATTLATLETS